jgi:hypothetical protein
MIRPVEKLNDSGNYLKKKFSAIGLKFMRRFGQKIIRQVFWSNRIKVIRRFTAVQGYSDNRAVSHFTF